MTAVIGICLKCEECQRTDDCEWAYCRACG